MGVGFAAGIRGIVPQKMPNLQQEPTGLSINVIGLCNSKVIMLVL